MKRIVSTMALAALLSLTAASSGGEVQNVNGWNRVDVPANSDVVCSVPFTKKAVGSYTVTAKDGTGLSISASLTADEFAGKYYVLVTSGAAEGFWSTISSNTVGGQLVLADTSFLGDIVANQDEITIYPHQMLGDVFPDKMKDISFLESSRIPNTPIITSLKTQILTYESVPNGQGKAPNGKYLYVEGDWYAWGNYNVKQNDKILPPQSFFIIRNENNDKDLLFLSIGNVSGQALAVTLVNGSNNDVLVTTNSPVPVKLKDLGLGGTNAFVDSTMIPNTPIVSAFGDQLLTFPANQAAVDEAYQFTGGKWVRFGDPDTTSSDDVQLLPSRGMIIRKNATGSGSYTWKLTPAN